MLVLMSREGLETDWKVGWVPQMENRKGTSVRLEYFLLRYLKEKNPEKGG